MRYILILLLLVSCGAKKSEKTDIKEVSQIKRNDSIFVKSNTFTLEHDNSITIVREVIVQKPNETTTTRETTTKNNKFKEVKNETLGKKYLNYNVYRKLKVVENKTDRKQFNVFKSFLLIFIILFFISCFWLFKKYKEKIRMFFL